MIPIEIQDLLQAEHHSSGASVGIEEYIKKLAAKAEIFSLFEKGCKGFVAFYCNNIESKSAFITTVVVHPNARGKGIAKMLLRCVLATMRERGFIQCSLEVQKTNIPAYKLYKSLGFDLINEKDQSYILALRLNT
jgi:[ribosomal protein S18]-alanine N-acetyltransferase